MKTMTLFREVTEELHVEGLKSANLRGHDQPGFLTGALRGQLSHDDINAIKNTITIHHPNVDGF